MLRLIRRRSLSISLAVVAAVGVLAMLAGTLAVAWAMFLSPHDLTVVTTVVAMAAVVSLATALLLGRWVVARSRELAVAARSFGDGLFTAPDVPATAELEAVSRELAATSARLAESREREGALETSRRELVAWISPDLRTPLAGPRAMSEALEDGVATDPDRYLRQIRTEVERLNGMVGDLFELSRIPTSNPVSGFRPRSARRREESAVMCRTSPSRYSPVTTGSGSPYAAARDRAISPTVCRSPLPVLYAVSAPGAEGASSATASAAATSRTCRRGPGRPRRGRGRRRGDPPVRRTRADRARAPAARRRHGTR